VKEPKAVYGVRPFLARVRIVTNNWLTGFAKTMPTGIAGADTVAG
jgi:hypothetical protein